MCPSSKSDERVAVPLTLFGFSFQTISQFLFWNLLPVTIGNIVAGALFTGAALYMTYPTATMHPVGPAPQMRGMSDERQVAFAPAATTSLNPM
jgi:hypothetical protein